jgi:hypothetical protein
MNATAMITPARPQHMRALERANEVRLARAELKRRVAFGKMDAAEVILYCPWEAHSMAVAELLTSQYRWGQARCRKVLAQLPISEGKTVGSMTDRQRRALAAMLTSDERRRPCENRAVRRTGSSGTGQDPVSNDNEMDCY